MEESSNSYSIFPSWQWILTKLEELLDAESTIQGSPWVSNLRINELFQKKYNFLPEDVAKANGLSFKSAIVHSQRFSIYNTQNWNEFYMARFDTILPKFSRDRPLHKLKYQIKRSWKVDGSFIKMLRSEGYEESSNDHKDSTSEIKSESQKKLQYESEIKLILEIKTVQNLELYLIKIVAILTDFNSRKTVNISDISQSFYKYYGQPIRPVIRTVCPDMKLIELLQVIPSLQVQQIEDSWQITLSPYF